MSVFLLKILFKKIIFTMVRIESNTSMELANCNLPTRIRLKLSLKTLLPLANSIVTVSKGIETDLKTIFPRVEGSIETITNSLDIADILEKSKEPVDHPWFKKYPVILFVGGLRPVKNIPLLLSSFSKVISNSSARLIVMGEGTEKKRLMQLTESLRIENRVDFVGFKDNPYAWMARSQLLVLSSIYEGLPTVLMEALVCGTSIVSTNCPSGPEEILENGKYGTLVPVCDQESLTQAILKTFNNPFDKDVLMEKAKQYSIENSVKTHLKVLEKV